MESCGVKERLVNAAVRISSSRGENPAGKFEAFSKIIIQPRRDWKRAGAPRVGWKRGELVEVFQARSAEERAEEWGDVGYYAAQAGGLIWWLYALFTPLQIIERAAEKFERRALKGPG